MRAHLSQVADDVNEEVGTEDNEQPLVVNTLSVPGHGLVHKTTLVAKLNSCPDSKLTWDRSVRVRYGNRSLAATSDSEGQEQVGLFDDVAVHIKERGKPSQWKLGSVFRIRNKEKTTVDYRRPVNIKDTKTYPKLYFMLNNV